MRWADIHRIAGGLGLLSGLALPSDQQGVSVTNGDLLELLQQAWHLINGAGGTASDGDWEKQSPLWAQQAAAWRGDYHELRRRVDGDEAALEARIRDTLQQPLASGAVSGEQVAAILRLACAYAEDFPANYVMRNPPAGP